MPATPIVPSLISTPGNPGPFARRKIKGNAPPAPICATSRPNEFQRPDKSPGAGISCSLYQCGYVQYTHAGTLCKTTSKVSIGSAQQVPLTASAGPARYTDLQCLLSS